MLICWVGAILRLLQTVNEDLCVANRCSSLGRAVHQEKGRMLGLRPHVSRKNTGRQ